MRERTHIQNTLAKHIHTHTHLHSSAHSLRHCPDATDVERHPQAEQVSVELELWEAHDKDK